MAPRGAYEWAGLRRNIIAWAVGVALLLIATAVIADPTRAEALTSTAKLWTVILGIDALVAASYLRRPAEDRSASEASDLTTR